MTYLPLNDTFFTLYNRDSVTFNILKSNALNEL